MPVPACSHSLTLKYSPVSAGRVVKSQHEQCARERIAVTYIEHILTQVNIVTDAKRNTTLAA